MKIFVGLENQVKLTFLNHEWFLTYLGLFKGFLVMFDSNYLGKHCHSTLCFYCDCLIV